MKKNRKILFLICTITLFVIGTTAAVAQSGVQEKVGEDTKQKSIRTDSSGIERNEKLDSEIISPTASVGTGYVDSFQSLENKDGKLILKTSSNSLLSVGVGSQTLTSIKIDKEIASEFFATENYKQYIGGTVDRQGGLIGTDTIEMSKLWDKKTNIISGYDTAYYDAKTGLVMIYSPKSIATISMFQNVNLEINLDKWAKDTGKLVERRPSYLFEMQSAGADLGINFSWGTAKTALNASSVPENSWQENKMNSSTITSSDDTLFKGKFTIDSIHHHATNYSVELYINGSLIKEVEANSGEWEYKFADKLKDGSVFSVKVKGTEKNVEGNGSVDVKYSEVKRYQVGTDYVDWNEWDVQKATITQGYDAETIVTGIVPLQNYQADRTYTFVVRVNGLERHREQYSEPNEFFVPVFNTTLKKNDKIDVEIIGHQEGEEDKSVNSTMIVLGNEDGQADWDKWELSPAVVTDAYADGSSVHLSVPGQSKFNSRSYDIVLYLEDSPIYEVKGFSSIGLDKVVSIPNRTLKVGDKLRAVLVGHEPATPDKGPKETVTTVIDNTGWDSWTVDKPSLESMTDQDSVVKGNIPAQSLAYDRKYKIKIMVNGDVATEEQVEPYHPFSIDLPEGIKVKENDKVSAEVYGIQKDRDDKKSLKVEQIVKDGSNWVGWELNLPELNKVTEKDQTLNGNVGIQNTEFGRTYEIKVLINEISQGFTPVESGGEFTFDLKDTKLSIGDTVEIQLFGHQEGKADKIGLKVAQVVEDGSNWAGWKITPPTLNKVTVNDKNITGTIGKQNTEFGRNYKLAVYLNNNPIGLSKVESGEEFTFDLKDNVLLKGNKIKLILIGYQDGKGDKISEEVEQDVEEEVFLTTSKFEKGYWDNFGLVYEGKIDNKGWDLSDISKVEKSAVLVNESTGEKSANLEVLNTDWYEKGRYNGYQIIVDNNLLGSLKVGDYVIRMTVTIGGIEVDEQDISLSEVIARMGPIHDNYADLEQVVVMKNTVIPEVSSNRPGIKISLNTGLSKIELFNKYWNKSNQLVFDGYFNNENEFLNTTKKLVIENSSGETVYEKNNLTAAPTSWGLPTGITDEMTFQVIVPNAYSNQRDYKYRVFVKNNNGEDLLDSFIE